MRGRALLGMLLAAAVLAAAAGAKTRSYTTGTIAAPLPLSGTLERALRVPDPGPVDFVRVSFRFAYPRAAADLSVSLVSPAGTDVPLATHRGGTAAGGFGSDAYGSGCSAQQAVFADSGFAPVAEAEAPFTDGPYVPEQPLAALDGEEARGAWTLRIRTDRPGTPGVLRCFSLDVSRDVPSVTRAARGPVTAELTYRERDQVYAQPRLRIVRAGRLLLDAAVPRLGGPGWRPTALRARDLDGDGEPEVLLDSYTGGAHCCSYTLIYAYDRAARTYRRLSAPWGNAGYRAVDLDRDGRVELVTADDRFAYAFTSYAGSGRPIRIARFERRAGGRGRLVIVTRRFPGRIRRDAALWRQAYREAVKERLDVRGVVAAWVADQLLLGNDEAAWRFVEEVIAAGQAGPGDDLAGWPTGDEYRSALKRFLRRTGYLP